jgi:hypothetical protein
MRLIMIEFPDVKIKQSAEWLLDREITSMDVEAILVIVGLFLISWSLRSLRTEMAKATITVVRLDKTVEENSDAIIEGTRSQKDLTESIKKKI